MPLHVFNGDRWERCPNIEAARSLMTECIDAARDFCDPEWPDWVEHIACFDAPTGCAAPDEDGKAVLVTRMIHLRDAEPGEGVDFWCDYEVARPHDTPKAGRE